MLLCIKQHVSIIWSSIHDNAKQMLSGKKCVGYKKKRVFRRYLQWKRILIHFLSRREFEVVFAWIVKKSVLLVQFSWILKLWLEDWPL